ncbi:MAG: trigger factor [Candidatus Paceibacterota bacterium]
MKVDIKKLDHSEVELQISVPTADFMAGWQKAFKVLSQKTKIDGFRPGMAPEKVLIDKIGEDNILIEMADATIKKVYPDVIKNHELDVIGAPEVVLTKLAKDNPLEFKIKTAVMPTVKLPDYKKIAKKTSSEHPLETTASPDEVEKVITEILTQRQKTNTNKDGADAPKAETNSLPELTDDLVKTFGPFKGVADFKAKIKTNIEAEKEHKSREKRRLAIVEAIGQEAKFDLPPVLIEHETTKMLGEMKHQIEQMGMKFDDYLTHLKKTEQELKDSWQDEAKKRVVFGLVVHTLAEAEKIKPAPEETAKYKEMLKTQMGPEGGKVDEARLNSYVVNVLTNEKVMDLLDPKPEPTVKTKA